MGIVGCLRSARDRRADAVAERAFRAATARWQPDALRLDELIDTAQSLGTEPAVPPPGCPLALRGGEVAFSWLASASLLETSLDREDPRVGAAATSFRMLRNVRWRVGASRVPVEVVSEAPAVIDVGSVTITNQRVVFQGAKHVRVWTLSKLFGIYDDATTPWTAIAVSNYEKVMGLLYTVEVAEEFRFRLHLAIADQQGSRDEFVAVLEHERVQHDAARPVAPVPGRERRPAAPVVTAWPGWVRIALPALGLALLATVVFATRGHGPATFGAASASPTSIAPRRTLPSVPTTTAQHRTTTTTRATKPRGKVPPATTSPTTGAGATGPARLRPAVNAVHTSPPPAQPPADPPASSPPGSSPPGTSPPATSPPTSPPTTAPPPTTTPPTTTPPTTEPPTVEEGAPCSPVGALGVDEDGTPMICTGRGLAGLTGPYRWQVLVP